MIRLSALNYDSSEDSEPEPTQESIKQAKENEALDLYNKALELQQKGDSSRAEEAYKKLLGTSLVKEAPPPGDDGLTQPGQVLKYSAYKNLAVLAEARDDVNTATDCYLEAVQLDDSDVTVWFHIGQVAMKSFDLCLARQAFEQGLRCNPKHWPCMDSLCTVLYAIGDYVACLQLIAKSLDMDEEYLKGLALRDKIFSEEPYHKRDFQNFRSLFTRTLAIDIDEEGGLQFVSEALRLREERFKLAKLPELPPVVPVKELVQPTWSCLGECFIAIYDRLTAPSNTQPLGSRVDLESYYKAIIAPDMSSSYRSGPVKSSDYSSSASFSTEGFGVYNTTQTSDADDKNKKGIKRKKQWQAPSTLDAEFLPKRRSARVRTNKKKQEEVNYQDIILSFLPTSLLKQPFTGDDDSSQDDTLGEFSQSSQRLTGLDQKQSDEACPKGQQDPYEEVIAGEAETLDVLTFVKEHMKNGGIIELMNQYGICLAYQCHKKWPSGLADVFLKVYSRIRKHVVLPSEFICDQDEKYRMGMARLILVATEFNLDKLQTAKSKSSSSLSPASSPRGGATGISPIRIASGITNKYLATDVEYLHNIACDRSFHGDFWLVNAIRVNWSKARYLMLQGQMDHAMINLERCTKLLTVKISPLAEPITVKLVNCRVDNFIALEQVEKKLESLQRCQSLEEVHRLFDVGLYEDVVQLLKGTLYQPQPKTRVSELGMSIPERPAQLLLLLDSLIKLKDFKQCLTCAEVSLNEATAQMIPCEAWSTTLARMFTAINTCISQGKEVLDFITKDRLQRMTQNLIKVIEASMYAPENSTEPPLATAMPWVLMYKIIHHGEVEETLLEKQTGIASTPAQPQVSSTSSNPLPDLSLNKDNNLEVLSGNNDIPNLPRSLQFLHSAHDHLGRRGWCCGNDGAFLLLYVDVLKDELYKQSLIGKEELLRDLEQCFLCLYGHPSKKAKARGLQEHNSPQIPLTWHNAEVVFDYFKPKELPTFDGANKTNTITNEVHTLMRRITEIVPQEELEAIKFENVQTFIDGTVDDIPKLPPNLIGIKRPVVSELFYLLADFYFKNKEFSKALKFYMHDICIMPNRADSWAAMALAHKSRLESKLNACEPKSMGPMQKHAVSALRCFKRALEVDSSNCSLWEEYGTLSYVLHSHASRQLRQLDEEEMSAETRLLWTKRREEMLLQAEQCFKSALDKEDGDSWLHYYMLGKIAEKLDKPLGVCLEQFQQASKELDEEGAEYPKKINFYSPPELALEALEVYFRLHVSIIKALFNSFPDVDTNLLKDHIQRAAKGPFYHPELDVESLGSRADSSSLEVSTNSDTKIIEVAMPNKLSVNSLEERSVTGFDSTVGQVSMDDDVTNEVSGISSSNEQVPGAVDNDRSNVVGESYLVPTDFEKDISLGSTDVQLKDSDIGCNLPLTNLNGSKGTPANQDVQDIEMKDHTNSSENKDEEITTEVSHIDERNKETASSSLLASSRDNSRFTKNIDGEENNAPKTTVVHSISAEPSLEILSMEQQISCLIDKFNSEETESEKQCDDPKNPGDLNLEDKLVLETEKIEIAVDNPDKSTSDKKNEASSETIGKISKTSETVFSNTAESSRQISESIEMQDVSFTVHGSVSNEAFDSTKTEDLSEKMVEDLPKNEEKSLEEISSTVNVSSKDKDVGIESLKSPTKSVAVKMKSVDLTPEQKKNKADLLDCCIKALEYCLRRFPQHHKSRYRLAYIYFYSDTHKDPYLSRDLLLGSNSRKKKDLAFPHQSMLNEKAKTNLFSAFWRIPEDDIDRPGSFCTHTYKSVELLLKVLTHFNEWDSLLQVSNVLYRTPEPGKKYLRDTERSCLARKAFDLSLQIIKGRVAKRDQKADVAMVQQLVLDVFEIWKAGQKYSIYIEATEKLLEEIYVAFRAEKMSEVADATDNQGSVLEQALKFCQHFTKPQTTIPSTPVSHSSQGSCSSGVETPGDETPRPPPVAIESVKKDITSNSEVSKSYNSGTVESSTVTSPTVTKCPDGMVEMHNRSTVTVAMPGSTIGENTKTAVEEESNTKLETPKSSLVPLPAQSSQVPKPDVATSLKATADC